MDPADEITEWMAKNGRKTLTREAAGLLAADSPDHWYVAPLGARGFMVGKMSPQKFSQRHVLVDATGQTLLFPTLETALVFLRVDLKVANPHVFNY